MGGELSKDSRSVKWLVTINNPEEKELTHEALKKILKEMNIVYWCMGDETGTEGTYHIHIYIVFYNQMRMGTLKKRFQGAHFDKCNGNSVENTNYVYKDGEKFNKNEIGEYEYIDKKGKLHKGTHYDETNEEWGELPDERQGRRTDITELYEMIKEGQSNYEILEQNPKYMMHMEKIDRARQALLEEKFKDTWRELEVCYIWGKTRTGKTRGVMEKYGYSKVYRVTDYAHPFDSYTGQDVIIFEEFRSSLKLEDMLKYLDGYPCVLPARFYNRTACFTKVYIISNIDIRKQYPNIQRESPEDWNAFLSRIHSVKVYNGHDTTEMSLDLYLDNENPFLVTTPFDHPVKEKESFGKVCLDFMCDCSDVCELGIECSKGKAPKCPLTTCQHCVEYSTCTKKGDCYE